MELPDHASHTYILLPLCLLWSTVEQEAVTRWSAEVHSIKSFWFYMAEAIHINSNFGNHFLRPTWCCHRIPTQLCAPILHMRLAFLLSWQHHFGPPSLIHCQISLSSLSSRNCKTGVRLSWPTLNHASKLRAHKVPSPFSSGLPEQGLDVREAQGLPLPAAQHRAGLGVVKGLTSNHHPEQLEMKQLLCQMKGKHEQFIWHYRSTQHLVSYALTALTGSSTSSECYSRK